MTSDQFSTRSCELSIVMPCLNEAETLEKCIVKAAAFLEKSGVDGEIVIGDNGSTDGSQAIATRNGARVVNVPIRGYGAAIFHAVLEARGRFVIMGDSDDSYDFRALMPFVLKLREGYGLVMGNRFAGGIRPGAMPWKNRYIGNPILSGIGRLFFRCPARDFHCGLRGFSRECFDRLDLRTTGMEFASEMVIKATLMKEKIVQVPTTLDPDGRSRPPHLRPWHDGWRHLRFMLLYSPQWLFLYPGLVLMAAGLIGVLATFPSDLVAGGLSLGVDTMLYSAMAVMAGYMAVTFSLFTKIFAIAEGLLPEDPKLSGWLRRIKLEAGLTAGFAIVLISIAGGIHSVLEWQSGNFGQLEPARMLRLVIPSAFGFLVGVQTILASFFLSVLGMRMRTAPRKPPATSEA